MHTARTIFETTLGTENGSKMTFDRVTVKLSLTNTSCSKRPLGKNKVTSVANSNVVSQLLSKCLMTLNASDYSSIY